MSAQFSKNSAATYRFQRYHIGLQEGHTLTVKQTREVPQPVHMLQGDIQSCCGLLCVCMVASMMSLAKPSALMHLTRRKYGTAARLWEAMEPYYFTGVTGPELKAAIDGLDLPLRLTIRHCNEDKKPHATSAATVSEFAVKKLGNGVLTMLAYRSLKDRHAHWQLGTGVSGVTNGKSSRIDTLLTLDPAEAAPHWSHSNSRLRMPDSKAEQRAGHWTMDGPGCYTPEPVRLISAIAFERVD